MVRNPVTWLREVLSAGGSDRPESPDSTDTRPEREPAGLYECTNCEATFIGVDKQSCSQCGGPVQEIPNEADLASFRSDD